MTILCKCGQPTLPANNTGHVSPIDAAMNTYTRLRKCPCGRTTKTVELLASELAELRRCRYVLELQRAAPPATAAS